MMSISPNAPCSPAVSRRIKHKSWTECQVTLPGSMPDLFQFSQIEPVLGGVSAAVLHADFIGKNDRMTALAGEIRRRGIAAPETILLPEPVVDGGMQLGVMWGIDSVPVLDGDRLIGRLFEDADAKYCYLGDVRPSDPAAARADQTSEVFETLQRALAGVGLDFNDVIRTWFYNDRILDWYGDFNRVRTAFFEKHGLVRMPASTGIGAPNGAGAALVAKAIAVRPKTGNVVVKPVHSPLQCEAAAYGSSFSRAMEVADPFTRTVYVSGTASIEPGGRTVYLGNAAGQIEKTMEVVNALLAEAGMDLSDTTRAIAYFRQAEDIALWHAYCRTMELPPIPIILTPSDVCRDDLLFEIELDAAVDV